MSARRATPAAPLQPWEPRPARCCTADDWAAWAEEQDVEDAA